MKKLFILLAVLCAPALYAADNYVPYQRYDNRYGTDRYAYDSYKDTVRYGLYTNTTRVELMGGVSFITDDWKQNGQTLQVGDTGFTAGLAFVRNILPWLSLGLDGNYAGFSKGDNFTTTNGQAVNYRSGVATGLVAGRLYLFPKSMTRLYGTAGIGAAYMYAKEKSAAGDTNKTYDSTDLAWMLGAGLEFDIDESVVFGLEGRYNRLGLRSQMKQQFAEDNFHYWTVMLKLGLKF